MYIASWFKLHFLVEAVSYFPLVQMTFRCSCLIFICPDPILDHFYLITVLLHKFKKIQQVNSSNLLTIWIILCGSVAHNILVFTWSQRWHQRASMCLNFNFCLYHSSVMDFKSRISSSVCGKLSMFKHQNKILNSISKAPFKQTTVY